MGGIAEQEEKRKLELRNKNIADLTNQFADQREDDLAKGRQRGEQVFAPGSLGRVDEGRSAEVAAILARRQAESNGFTPEEMNSYRTTNVNASNQAFQGAQRALATAQGRSGVHGATAAAQQARLLLDRQNQVGQDENSLFQANIAARRAGLDALETSTTGARADELARQKYNQGQSSAEKQGQLTTELGYGSLGAGDRASAGTIVTGKDQAEAAKQAAEHSGGGICCFIFLEARYGNGTMDNVVRRFRDEHLTIQRQRGYYKLAEVLVPAMRKSQIIKGLVRVFMTDPCVSYGRYFYEKKGLGWIFKPVVSFWLSAFEYLGGKHEFIRENGEVI